MTEEQLYKIAKISAFIAACAIALTLITIPIIQFVKQEQAPITWEHVDDADKNRDELSPIQFRHRTLSMDNISTKQQETEPEVIEAPVHANADINTASDAVTINRNYSQLSQECNAALYSLCQKNFSVSVNNISLSPLIPMVIANVETGARCNPAITFSSLYPSKILTPTVQTDIYNVSCLDVISSNKNFEVLASEYWTRDRGPCQMSPSYGIHDDTFNASLGRSEADILSNISESQDYTAYTTREGKITYSNWIEQASTEKGDRFNPKDICLRLSSEYTYALTQAAETYPIETGLLATVMCAMHHGASSLWLPEYKEDQIGLWKSGVKAFELASSITTQTAYDIIKDEVIRDITDARSNNDYPSAEVTTKRAMQIYKLLKDKEVVKDKSSYITDGQFSDDYLTYPIKVLYSYIQLSLLYNGG